MTLAPKVISAGDLRVGMSAEYEREIKESDVLDFAAAETRRVSSQRGVVVVGWLGFRAGGEEQHDERSVHPGSVSTFCAAA